MAGTPDFRRSSLALAPLLSQRHGKAPARWHVVNKPGPQSGRQAVREPSPPGPLNATPPTHCHPGRGRTVYQEVSIRRFPIAVSGNVW